MRILLSMGVLALLLETTVAEDAFDRVGSLILPRSDLHTIILAEEITAATPLDLKRALQRRPDATTIVLASEGGSLYGALLMATEIHERGLNTHIPADFGCYSSCAFMFLAGANRKANGELGVHQFYGPSDIGTSATQFTVADIMETLAAFDVEPGVISAMLRTPPNEMYVFSEAEIADLSIERSDGARPSEQTDQSPRAVEIDRTALTIAPKTTSDAAVGRVERILTVSTGSSLADVLRTNGFTDPMIDAIDGTLRTVFPSTVLPAGARLRVLFGPSRNSNSLIPYRLSIYLEDQSIGYLVHRATVALNDRGAYVLGLAPFPIDGEPPIARTTVGTVDAANPTAGKQDRALPIH